MPGRVSHVTANWFRCRPRTRRGPWHWHPSRFPSGDRTSRVCPHPSPIAGPWHWLRDGSLVNMVIPGSYARYPYWWRRRWWWLPVKRLSLSPFSRSSFLLSVSRHRMLPSFPPAGRPALRAWLRHPGKFFYFIYSGTRGGGGRREDTAIRVSNV